MSTATLERVELGRFLTITGRRFDNGGSAPEMFSGAIDAAWHRLLDDPDYPQLCAETAGQLIAHAEICGAGPVTWITEYEELYGPLPDIWFADAHGVLDTEAAARYRQTGQVVWAEWNCAPKQPDDDAAPKEQSVR